MAHPILLAISLLRVMGMLVDSTGGEDAGQRSRLSMI